MRDKVEDLEKELQCAQHNVLKAHQEKAAATPFGETMCSEGSRGGMIDGLSFPEKA